MLVRRKFTAEVRDKPQDIMDVAETAVRDAFARTHAQHIVHGHTHRPAEHLHEVGGRLCERVVLADWRPERMEAVALDETGYRRVPLPAA